MVEFTGERVIPGQVNDDLWSEHVARYAFARRYAHGKRVLDAGCGTGYGSAELAQSAAEVTGVDIAADAIEYASANYPIAGLRFLESSCTAVPFPPESFDLVVAFEVIEHLTDYRAFLDECARLLTREGLFIVSSPNKRYYAETRAATGPNPFHEHEFEAEEFVRELERVFPNVRLLLQNRVESFAFHPAVSFWPAEARIDGGGGSAEDAHFFIALCSRGQLPEPKSFVYVPKAANMLRERELHVEALERQLAEIKADRQTLLELFRQADARTRRAQRMGAAVGYGFEDRRRTHRRIAKRSSRAGRGLSGSIGANGTRGPNQDRMGAQNFRRTGSQVPGAGPLRQPARRRRSHRA